MARSFVATPPPMPMLRRGGRRPWPLVAAVAAAVVAVTAVVVVTRDHGGDAAAGPRAMTVPQAPAAPPPTTAVPPSSAPTTSTVASAPPAPGRVDAGLGVGFALPQGWSQQPIRQGIDVTNGVSHLFVSVTATAPGSDPLPVLQAYLDGIDPLYDATATTPAFPLPTEVTAAGPVDGYHLDYRVMSADATGYVGTIEVRRRADGLVLLRAVSASSTDAATAAAPDGAIAELSASFTAAPAVATPVELPPLAAMRVASVHPALLVDGLVAVSPPPAWAVEAPGPLRVALTEPSGARIVVTRLTDTTDPSVAMQLALAALLAEVPDAVAAPFAPVRADGVVLSFEATFTGSSFTVAQDGTQRVWVDTSTGATYSMIAFHVAGVPLAGVDLDFVREPLDASIVALR